MHFNNSITLTLREWNYLARDSFSPNLKKEETDLLDKVYVGDVDGAKSILKNATQQVNIGCKGKRNGRWGTPLQIAAMNNDFYMIQLLLDNGAEPLKRHCQTSPYGYCEDIVDDESRLQMYQSLCSPIYLTLVNNDPVITAMELSAELRAISHSRDIVDTTKERYISLKQKINQFILDMLECCRSSEEVKILLMGDKGHLTVLSKAIETKQIQFVANPKCHRVARNEWLRGQPKWHRRDGFGWTLLYHIYCVFVYLCFLPILAIIYIIFPCSSVRFVLDTPKAKFIMQILSYFLLLVSFLILNLYYDFTLLAESQEGDWRRQYLSYAILIHCIALLWTEILRMRNYGLRMYMADLWNFLHLVSILSVIMDTALRPFDILYCLDASFIAYWDTSTGPFLTLSSLRFLHCMFLNAFLGPILLLFIAMLWDVVRFIIVFAFTVLSFSFGFYYLYFTHVDQFSRFDTSVMTLMSMIFGSDPSREIVFITPANTTVCSEYADATIYYKIFGYTLYVVFGLLALVILLNICIAMMSDTYSRLQEQNDAYWKFFRTKVWIEYMLPNAPVLPAPYSIIPSISCLKYVITRLSHPTRRRYREDIEMSADAMRNYAENTSLSYKELMKILKCRYLIKEGLIDSLSLRSLKEDIIGSTTNDGGEARQANIAGRFSFDNLHT